MKFGINLYLWADDMHDGLMPVLERLKQIGFDGVEVPIFDLDRAKWALWALYHLNTLDQAIRCIDEVGHPNCRIHLDTFHAHIEEKDPAAAIRRAGSRIAHVHISENDRGTPGTGSVEWDATFGALRDIGHDGWLTVEAFGNFLPNLAAATKIWRKLFDSEDQLAAESFQFLAGRWERGSAPSLAP
jgi:sugar phosphate isomerase/epimerase